MSQELCLVKASMNKKNVKSPYQTRLARTSSLSKTCYMSKMMTAVKNRSPVQSLSGQLKRTTYLKSNKLLCFLCIYVLSMSDRKKQLNRVSKKIPLKQMFLFCKLACIALY